MRVERLGRGLVGTHSRVVRRGMRKFAAIRHLILNESSTSMTVPVSNRRFAQAPDVVFRLPYDMFARHVLSRVRRRATRQATRLKRSRSVERRRLASASAGFSVGIG
jgi:hypothetical protein